MNIKKIIKITLTVIALVIIAFLVHDNYYLIINKIEYVYKKYLVKEIRQTLTDNDYRKKENYEFVQINLDTNIKNKEDAKNAIYTFLDGGWDEYTVKCDADYLNCTSDVKSIVENNTYLTDLSNFVHPFNTFERINTTFTSTGRIILKRKNRYTKEQINKINQKIDEIYNKNYDPNKSITDNIKIFHDYIINNTKYDTENVTGTSLVNSSSAYGVLFDGIGICSGYTDVMQLFLEKLKVKNYRISSSTHVWNLVYIDGSWLHLDLTWDDPISKDNVDSLNHDYFLINTEKLKSLSDKEHNFNEEIYVEAK